MKVILSSFWLNVSGLSRCTLRTLHIYQHNAATAAPSAPVPAKPPKKKKSRKGSRTLSVGDAQSYFTVSPSLQPSIFEVTTKVQTRPTTLSHKQGSVYTDLDHATTNPKFKPYHSHHATTNCLASSAHRLPLWAQGLASKRVRHRKSDLFLSRMHCT